MRVLTLDRRLYLAQLLVRAVAAGLLVALWESPWSLALTWALTWGIDWLVPFEPRTRPPSGWSSGELLSRIAADTTDADADRHLPPSLRR